MESRTNIPGIKEVQRSGDNMTLNIIFATMLLVYIIAILFIYVKRKLNDTNDYSVYNDRPLLRLNDDIQNIISLYEKMGIMLPYDIIEELDYHNFHSEVDIIAFIENKRNHWKLECSKKMKKDLFTY